jgi:lipoate---protein ligase
MSYEDNMKKTITEKVPGGKLVRVKVDFGEKINSLQITGDFFLHPEDMIEEIEKGLVGCSVGDELQEKIQQVISQHNIELIGFSAEDIARLVKKAVNQ